MCVPLSFMYIVSSGLTSLPPSCRSGKRLSAKLGRIRNNIKDRSIFAPPFYARTEGPFIFKKTMGRRVFLEKWGGKYLFAEVGCRILQKTRRIFTTLFYGGLETIT